MMMIVEVPEGLQVQEITSSFEQYGKEEGLDIHVMAEDIFNAMHTI